MLETLRHRRWDWVAFGAAFMLVAQLLLGGFMLGHAAAAATASGDIFGVICSSTGGAAAPEAPSDNAALQNCCVLGCPGLATAALPPAATISPAALPDAEVDVPREGAALAAADGDGSPVRARGPPLLPA
jgi:hypothetical protein